MAPPPVPNWQAQILKGIGAPVTPQNLLYLNDWAKAEGGAATNNPFNTTQGAPGATAYNSNGGNPVKNYSSPQQGIGATIQTLQNGRYGGIIGALRQGTSARSAADALAASPWGTGSLVQKMLGGGGGGGSAPAVMRPPVSPGAAAPIPAAPGGSNLLGQLLSQTNQMVGLGANPTLAGLLTGGGPGKAAAPAAPATPGAVPALPGRGGLAELLNEGTGGPTHSTGPHVHAAFTDPQLELAAIAQAQRMGLHVGENPYVGSLSPGVHAPHSYHNLTFPGLYNGRRLGEAIDVSGGNTAPFYSWLAQRKGR